MIYKKLFLVGVMATGLSVGLMGTEISEIQKEVNELIDAYVRDLPAGISKEEIKQDIANYFTQEGLKALKHCIDVPDECRFPGVHNYEIIKASCIEMNDLYKKVDEEKRKFLRDGESSLKLIALEQRISFLREYEVKFSCDKVTLQFIDEMLEAYTLEKTLSILKKYTGTFFPNDVFDKFAQEDEATLEKIVLYIGMLRTIFAIKK